MAAKRAPKPKKRKVARRAPPERRDKRFKAKPRRAKRGKLRALPWRVAYSLDKTDGLLAQVNARVPGRSRASDGSIGDTAHQSRTSDHNAWRRDGRGQPVVGAIDITHDPKNGVDTYALAESLRVNKDPRVKYVISNGRIWSPSISPAWRKYNGTNPHDHHVHVSVSDNVSLFDRRGPWKFDLGKAGQQVPGDVPIKVVVEEPVLREGNSNIEKNKELQKLLGITADGIFGPGTKRAVTAFQTARGLTADGVVGPQTWRSLRAAKATAPNPSMPVVALPTSVEQIREYVFEDEGPELNVHPHEPGGASRLGISIDTLSAYLGRQATVEDLRNMSDDTAWKIYDEKFWDQIGADKLPAGLNYAAFDFAVNSGPAIVDGVLNNNPKILEDYLATALKEKTVEKQIDKLCDLRLEHMKKDPEKWAKYKNGWSARVARVRTRSQNMAGSQPTLIDKILSIFKGARHGSKSSGRVRRGTGRSVRGRNAVARRGSKASDGRKGRRSRVS